MHSMMPLPSFDAHAHFNPTRTSAELANSGTVLAMTLSLDEAAQVMNRQEPQIAWGVGCHPRKPKSEESFNVEKFEELALKTAVIGEIGLDTGSRVPLETQLHTFRQILRALVKLPRIISIHSYQATSLVTKELQQNPVTTPVLHWWTGNAEETRQAVSLGCYFSVHSAIARHSKFRTAVPRERLLVESDHGWADPPAAIPCRIQWAEYLLAAQLKLDVSDVRRLVWHNFASLVHKTETTRLLPKPLATLINKPDQNVDCDSH